MKQSLASLVIIGAFGIVQAGNMTVSLDDVVLLSQRGVSDETILVLLQNREIGFVPAADDIDSLLEAGVSEEVIRYLLQKTAGTPLRTYAPVVYVDPYPVYYYRPYYSGSSLYFGYSTFPHTSYRHGHHGVGHHSRPHHPTPLHLTHNDRGKHGLTHTGGGHGKTGSFSHNSSSVSHGSSSASHNSSSGHSRSGGFGHRGGHGSGHSGGHGGGH